MKQDAATEPYARTFRGEESLSREGIDDLHLQRSIPVAFIALAAVLNSSKVEAISPVHTDVNPPDVVLAVARVAEVDLWLDTIKFNNVVRWNAVVKQNAETVQGMGLGTISAPSRLRRAAAVSAPSGNCGGALPSCAVMMRESGGDIHAMNPSGAAGKWQIMPGTWDGFMGYASAADAPEWVQDAKAETMAACNWSAPNYCG